MHPSKNPAPTCLLCDHPELREHAAWTGREVRTLYGAVGHVLAWEDLAPIAEETRVILHECARCGFRFFDPRFAGGAAFYHAIDSEGYYPGRSREFDYGLEEMRRRGARRLLDIGGGDGAFLDLAAQAGLETHGLEINAQAAARAAAKGHRMIAKPLEALSAEDTGGGFDAVTLFQVVEHVPDPVGFLRAVAPLVGARGCVVIAVPHEQGVRALCPDDPMNLPPHHVSRWRAEDLRRLAERAGYRCLRAEGEALYGHSIAYFTEVQQRLSRASGRPTPRFAPGTARLLSFLYRKAGARHFFPRKGMNLMAVLAR